MMASPFISASSGKRLLPSWVFCLGGIPSGCTPSNVGITINLELLEEKPPAAGESWKQMVQGLPSPHERRTTFGLGEGILFFFAASVLKPCLPS